jgi:hypothetical protein
MRFLARSATIVALLLIPLGAAATEIPVPSPSSPSLADVLAGQAPDRLLDIQRRTGPSLRGFVAGVGRDSLHLRAQDADTLVAVALESVLTVRVWQPNTRQGAGIGAASGVVIAGAFGALLGAYLATYDGSDGAVGGALAGFAIVGAAGAAAGGLLGAGIGSLSHGWHTVWPQGPAPPQGTRLPPPGATRLGLFAGAAQSRLEGYEVTRLAARVGLRRDAGRRLSLGPEIAYDHFDGSFTRPAPGGGFVTGVDSILKFMFTANIRSRRPGLTPYATLGAGWFLSNDAYLGAHAGGGLQWRRTGRNDTCLDFRYNFNLTDVTPSQVAGYWTVGLSLGFGL